MYMLDKDIYNISRVVSSFCYRYSNTMRRSDIHVVHIGLQYWPGISIYPAFSKLSTSSSFLHILLASYLKVKAGNNDMNVIEIRISWYILYYKLSPYRSLTLPVAKPLMHPNQYV